LADTDVLTGQLIDCIQVIWLPIWQGLGSFVLSEGIQVINTEMLGNYLHFRKVEKSLKTRTACKTINSVR